jgi:hypothetical protein
VSTGVEKKILTSDGLGEKNKQQQQQQQCHLGETMKTTNVSTGVEKKILTSDGLGEKNKQQQQCHLGETTKTTNVSTGVEKKALSTFQQQVAKVQESSSHNRMTTAPQSPIPPPAAATSNTPVLVRSVKKATRVVSNTVRESVDTMKHEVVPATKAMAALTAKLVERGEKKIVEDVAPKLRAVANDIDARLNHNQQRGQINNAGGGFVGLEHVQGKGDYVRDPNYHVTRTPEHPDTQGGLRRPYGYGHPNAHPFDPNTPSCLLGALTAGTMCHYDITHPEHPEYLPPGIPHVLEIPEDWEIRAGFVPGAALLERVGCQPVDLDDSPKNSDVDDELEEDRSNGMLTLQKGEAMSYEVTPIKNGVINKDVEEKEVSGEEDDPRNQSMWVAVDPDEDMEEEDEIMNVGEIIIATEGGDLDGVGGEFSPRSLATGDSNTYYLGDVSARIETVEDEKQQEQQQLVTFQEEYQVHAVETVEKRDEMERAGKNYSDTQMKKVTVVDGEVPSFQQSLTDKKKEFQTPFSVKKGERPLTFEEFKALNRRVLFNNEVSERPQNEDADTRTEVNDQPQRLATIENGNFLHAVSSSGKRELKGRIVMIRIKKKISKTLKKALKQLLSAAKGGGIKTSSNKSIADASFVITIPKAGCPSVPDSPSAVSIACSLMSSAADGSRPIIGAAAVKINNNAVPKHLYGVVNYQNRSSDDSFDEEYEDIPPPSSHFIPRPERDEEDVVSFLAEAINHDLNVDEQEGDEEEEQMLLVLTPTEDGGETITQVISESVDGTPIVFNEIIHKSEDGSEIKQHNLSTNFVSSKKENNSIQIMDAVEVYGNIVLTPTETKRNVGNVFRPSLGGASASILRGSTIDSEEDSTLVTHDGNTIVRSDTYDQTITTTSSTMERSDRPRQEKPSRPAYSRQAETNASFLFSPNNMGRANPLVRAKERASNEGSITMLPSVASMDKSEQLVLKPKPSYSFDFSAAGEVKYGSALAIENKASLESEEPDTPSTISTNVQKKPVMASITNDRQFSFKTTLKKFASGTASDSNENPPSTEEKTILASPEVAFADAESEKLTPLVTNAVQKKYAATPFLKQVSNLSPSQKPLKLSIASFKSSGGRRKSSPRSPKGKIPPKSALKTRKGLVKDRINMFQNRVDMHSAVTDVNGRLKKNHSYRLKKERRVTNGGGALAPRKAVLQSSVFIRTVPIGLSTSYSRDDDSVEDISHAVEEPKLSYVKHYMDASNIVEKAESFGRSSLDSSSVVSETTECDAFNSLLGKMLSDEDVDSVESESSGETLEKHKENVSTSPNVAPSSFKSGSFVKPTEINHNRTTPLTPQKWRSMAATHGRSNSMKFGAKKRSPATYLDASQAV